jgi:L-lactate utilization protein LutB
MYKIHKMCFECVVDYEAELRKAGLYDAYEKNMMQGSMKAFARDVEQWVLDGLESVDTFVTEQGDVEDWNNNNSKFKEQITKNLQEYLKHLKSHIDS